MSCCGPKYQLDNTRITVMRVLQITVLCQIGFAICSILGTRYFDGAIALLTGIIYIIMLRETKRMGMGIMCMFIYNLIQAIWTVIYLILYIVGVTVYKQPGSAWQRMCLRVSIYGFPAVAIVACICSYIIFDFLRKIIWAPQGGDGQGNVDDLNRPGHYQEDTTHGKKGFGYDVENQAKSPKKDKQKKQDDDAWKKSGGQKLGGTAKPVPRPASGTQQNDPRNPWKK